MKELSNTIGRRAEGSGPPDGKNGERQPAEDDPSIDLGPSKMVSRHHAEIYFDSSNEKWWIHVNGRNGIKFNGELVRRLEKRLLGSGDVFEIGSVEMMFILPVTDIGLRIDPVFLRRAELIADEPEPVRVKRGSPVNGLPSSPHIHQRGQLPAQRNGAPGPLPIAPAPPDYKRPDTPAKQRTRGSNATQSPFGGPSGTMMMNTDHVDLSLDENSHIKPNFSYAQLITQAILSDPSEMLNLAGIYQYIMKHYSFYRNSESVAGWQVCAIFL